MRTFVTNIIGKSNINLINNNQMKEIVKKLNGNMELQKNINNLVDEMKKRGFYEIKTYKHSIYRGISEWYQLILKGQKGKPIGENDFVTVDINETYMNISHKLYYGGEFDLQDADFVELFFENFTEYEKELMEVKQPLLDHYDEVVKNISNVIGEDYMIVEFRDILVFKIRHIELNRYVFRFELEEVKNWFVQEFSDSFIKSFNDMYGGCDEDGEEEYNSLFERIGSLFNRDCEQ